MKAVQFTAKQNNELQRKDVWHKMQETFKSKLHHAGRLVSHTCAGDDFGSLCEEGPFFTSGPEKQWVWQRTPNKDLSFSEADCLPSSSSVIGVTSEEFAIRLSSEIWKMVRGKCCCWKQGFSQGVLKENSLNLPYSPFPKCSVSLYPDGVIQDMLLRNIYSAVWKLNC